MKRSQSAMTSARVTAGKPQPHIQREPQEVTA